MNFHEVRFPATISFGSSGGIERRTEIIELVSGREERNSPWAHSRRRYDAGLGIRSLDDLDEVLAFFEARRGRLYGFRWKDWLDHKSCAPSGVPAATDQAMAAGAGPTEWVLSKTYRDGGGAYVRPINKPVPGSVRVAVDGVELAPTAFAVNQHDGRGDAGERAGGRRGGDGGLRVRRGRALRHRPDRGESGRLQGRRDPVDPGHRGQALMRDIPASLRASLDGGVTRLARCWRLTRRDGAVMGFTDHDGPLAFEGVDFEPDAGFTPSAVESTTGLSPDTHEVTGALSSARITEADIVKGAYDGAEVALWLVDWADPASRLLVSRGLIGEIRRGDNGLFEAEITGLSDRLGQPFGRAYLAGCSCRLGDAKCGVDLSLPQHRGQGTVLSLEGPQQFTVAALGGFQQHWFAGGRLTWTTGANAGLSGHVKSHLRAGAEVVVELWLSPPMAIAAGDAFEVTAGCDRTAESCASKFGNLLNFRGFPHMPGDDVVASYANSGGDNDGGSLFRG